MSIKLPKDHKVVFFKNKPKGQFIVMSKPRRNEPCPCKSGKKAKHCCGTETKLGQRIPKPAGGQNG